MANNKLACSGHQMLPITPDGIPSEAPAVREALNDPHLRDLRVLRGSIFCPWNPWLNKTEFNNAQKSNFVHRTCAGCFVCQ